MVLIEVHKPDGGLVGRCDARCYNAKQWGSKCNCICGGANHACGLFYTVVRRIVNQLKKEYPENIVTGFGVQQNLFGGDKNE